MPLKTEAIVQVDADQLVHVNLGYVTELPDGTLTARLPQHVAKELADLGAVTIITDAVEH